VTNYKDTHTLIIWKY